VRVTTASETPWIASARILVGVLWLHEVVNGRGLGSVPEFGFDYAKSGSGAGKAIAEAGQEALSGGTWVWIEVLIGTLILPHAAFWEALATLSQVLFGLLLIVGAFTRVVNIGAALYLFVIIHFGSAGIGPIILAGHLFVSVTDAGQHYGIDAWLINRSPDGIVCQGLTRITTVGAISQGAIPRLIAVSGAASLCYLFVAIVHTGEAVPETNLEISVLFGLTVLAFVLQYYTVSQLLIGAEIIRLFVGYRFLHELLVRDDPAFDAVLDWTGLASTEPAFERIVDQHFGILETIVEVVFLSAIEFWVFTFTIAQTVLGLAVLVGWSTRRAGGVGICCLGILAVLGFTRNTVALFGLLILAWLVSGRYLVTNPWSTGSPPIHHPLQLAGSKIDEWFSRMAVATPFAVLGRRGVGLNRRLVFAVSLIVLTAVGLEMSPLELSPEALVWSIIAAVIGYLYSN
jgi:uncharacterized membrane protein YphA (DoxX/SURF4 family)